MEERHSPGPEQDFSQQGVSAVYQLSGATTNWGGLKQQKCILSWFWRPEVQDECWQGRVSPEALEERSSVPCSASGGQQRSLTWGHIPPISASSFLCYLPLPRSYKDTYDSS